MDEKNSCTVYDYLKWRGDLTFQQDEFNEVDNLILCIISYINFQHIGQLKTRQLSEAMKIGDVCALLTEEDEQLGLSMEKYIPLMKAAAGTNRFAKTRMFAFTSRHDEACQFDAVSFLLSDNSAFIAYMGTDLSLTGWREDFQMSYEVVPAQEEALTYAREIAEICSRKKLRIGGHSKGGNLAAYAAVNLPEKIQKRQLLAAYNNDGPGFKTDIRTTDGYRKVADRIFTFIPESSVIGVLLTHAEDYAIVDSNNKYVMQHEPLSWNVEGNHLVRMARRSQMGKIADDALQEWVASLSQTERMEFCDALFEILSYGGKAKTLDDLHTIGKGGYLELIRYYADADEEKKKIVYRVFHSLADDFREQIKKTTGNEIQVARKSVREVKNNLKKRVQTGNLLKG